MTKRIVSRLDAESTLKARTWHHYNDYHSRILFSGSLLGRDAFRPNWYRHSTRRWQEEPLTTNEPCRVKLYHRQFALSLEKQALTFSLNSIHLIECFHSHGQHLCKFIGTKESVCIRKECNSHRTGLGHQHGRCFIVLGHQYGRRDVMWKHSIRTPC